MFENTRRLMILLTIAIPTYNRLEYLKELLPGLLKQCKPYPEIEVLISDNCTTDGTFPYIRDISAKNPQVRYRRNSANVGGDENFVLCVESALGEYVWLFSDDEILCDKAIETIITILKKFPVSLLIVGLGLESEHLWAGTYAEFVKNNQPQTIINHALLTCNIFKKCLFDTKIARARSPTKFGHFAHVYAIVDSLKDGEVYITNSPVFYVRPTRAENKQKMKFIRLKYIELLLYVGVSYPRIIHYVCFGLIGASMRRQIRKMQRIVK
jgi:glycosyltransferase involved in cell wall biosynthesis